MVCSTEQVVLLKTKHKTVLSVEVSKKNSYQLFTYLQCE